MIVASGKKSEQDVFASSRITLAFATICWFCELSSLLNTNRTVDVQRAVEPVDDARALTVSKRWSSYKLGKQYPRKRLQALAEERVPGTRWVIDLLLWDALCVDCCMESIAGRLKGCTSQEGDELLLRMLNSKAHRWDRRWLRKRCESMVRQGYLDGLAVLLVCMRLARSAGNWKLNLAFELYVNDSLLVLGVWLKRHGVAPALAAYYEDEFLPRYGSERLRYKFDGATYAYSIARYEELQTRKEVRIGRLLTLQEQVAAIHKLLRV